MQYGSFHLVKWLFRNSLFLFGSNYLVSLVHIFPIYIYPFVSFGMSISWVIQGQVRHNRRNITVYWLLLPLSIL